MINKSNPIIRIKDLTKMKKTVFLLFVIATLSLSCSKYGYVKLNYPTSPQAFLPENIHTIALVNRSLTKKDDNASVIESIVSGEIAGSDKKASDECLKGVYDRINGWRQMNIVIPKKTRLYGTGTRETPELLDWKTVKQICDSTKSDALLVLESFDSNSDILSNALNNTMNAVITGNVPPPPTSQVRMNVVCYWRLYDPINQKIIDQYQSTSFMTFDGGNSVIAIPPPEALPQTAYHAGEEYIQRFLPSYYHVSRSLYKRGKGRDKQQFLTAFRKTEVANWEGAQQVWEPITKSNNSTNAGRACLNMAVAYEVLGKSDQALIWAKKAYEDYGNKLARDYQNQLKYRIRMEY
ncbi:MAG: hypothetical protein A3F72_14385 [Bacteroidetes bacterium RIFCSPLOWO2_12_FULL_35_15]|nr:MAG: hypothetical protein A3F72_14385 [Bacteroidetes bacterium RIFCSPLOWO2_12_FULL_35_15]